MDFLTTTVLLLVILIILSIVLYVKHFKKDQSYTFLTRNHDNGKKEQNENEQSFSNLFNFSPLKLNAKKLCPKLNDVDDLVELYTDLKNEFKLYVDMVALYAIMSKDDYRKKYLKYLGDYAKLYNIEISDDELERFKTFTPNQLEKLDGERIFCLGVMTFNGIGCTQDKELAYAYLRSAYCLNHPKATEIIAPFEAAFNWEYLSINLSTEIENEENIQWTTRLYVWSSLLASQEQDKIGMQQFSKLVLEDYEAEYFLADESAFNFALKCAETLAKDDPSIWLKLGKMLLNDEFEATNEQKNAKKYLKNAITYGNAQDKAEANEILSVNTHLD